MASNRNGSESNKNVKAMTSITNAQLPRQTINVLVSTKMKPIPPLKMGSEIYQCTKKAFEHLKEPRPKSLLKTFMNVKFKEVS